MAEELDPANLKVFGQRLIVSVVIPSAVCVLAFLLLLILVRHLDDVNLWVRHTDENLSVVNENRRAISSTLSTHRGYLLLKNSQELHIYEESKTVFKSSLNRLLLLARDNSEQSQRLVELQKESERLLATIEDKTVDMVSSEQEAEIIGLRMRKLYTRFIQEEERLRDERVKDAEWVARWLSISIIGGGLFLGSLLALYLSQLLRGLLANYSAALTAAKLNASVQERDRFFTLPSYLLCVSGKDGYFKQLSVGWERTLGYTRQELMAVPYIDFVHPEDRSQTEDTAVLSNKAEQPGFVNRYKTKEGGWVWLRWSSSPYEQGGLVYAVAVDVTQQRLSEQEIARLNEDLNSKVLQLDSLNREMESFCYSVSHDLRSPLRAIDGFGQALLRRNAEQLDPKGLEFLTRMRAAAQRMGHLIDDLLLLSRVNRGELKIQTVDLTALAQEIIQDLRSEEPARTVVVDIAENLQTQGDANLLKVMLTNLLSNAWKYTSKKPEARITFSVRDGVFCVADNGAGFDAAYVDKLFSPFQRLHTPREFEGNGVGLATVRRVLARHGGVAWAHGEIELGAQFYFTMQKTGGSDETIRPAH